MPDVEASAATPGGHRDPASQGRLVATLSIVALTVAVLQTGVVPVLGAIARQLDAAPVDVSWAVTANLLAKSQQLTVQLARTVDAIALQMDLANQQAQFTVTQ